MYDTKRDTEANTWQKLTNVILENKTHKHLQKLVYFNAHENEIINKNMPFMYK
jgi:hypothetical protein